MTSLDIVVGKRAKERSALGVIGEKDRQKSGSVLGMYADENVAPAD